MIWSLIMRFFARGWPRGPQVKYSHASMLRQDWSESSNAIFSITVIVKLHDMKLENSSLWSNSNNEFICPQLARYYVYSYLQTYEVSQSQLISIIRRCELWPVVKQSAHYPCLKNLLTITDSNWMCGVSAYLCIGYLLLVALQKREEFILLVEFCDLL